MDNNFEKLKASMRYFLIGALNATGDKKYALAAQVMEYAEGVHSGLRKDGVTPEFMHQIQIALQIRTYWRSLDRPIDTLIAGLTHDVDEDYPEEELRLKSLGEDVYGYAHKLSKVRNGVKLPPDIYFNEISECPVCSVVKGIDRVNNFQSMLNVFSIEKQSKYIEEAETWIIPMLKKARRNFPSQESVYENIKLIMRSQIELLEANIRTMEVVQRTESENRNREILKM